MKIILTLSLTLWLLLQAAPPVADLASWAAAAAIEPWAPERSVGMLERLRSTSSGLFADATLTEARNAAAIQAASRYADDSDIDLSRAMLERIDERGLARAPEAQALLRNLPRRRETLIENLLAGGDHRAALQQLAQAEGRDGRAPDLMPATHVRLGAEARVQALRQYLKTGDAIAAAQAMRSFPRDAPLPLRHRAEELMVGLVQSSTQHYAQQARWPDAYRLLHRVLQDLQPDASVGLAGALAARDTLDIGLFGRPTHCVVKIAPALHVNDPDAISPSTELVVQNASRSVITVTFAGGADGRREQASLAPGKSHGFVFSSGEFVQWLDAGPRGALTVIRLGGGSWRQVVGDDFDAEPLTVRPATPQQRHPVDKSRRDGRHNA